MKTANINGIRKNLEYRTSTEMYTRFSHSNLKSGQYGADAYNVIDDDSVIVLVATAHNGSTLPSTVKVISKEKWEELTDTYDPYNNFAFHANVMNVLGFS